MKTRFANRDPRRGLRRGVGISLLLVGLAWLVGPADSQEKQLVDSDHAAKMARGLEIFKAQVRPILTQKCLRCHGGKATESELDLNDRPGLLKGGAAGPAVITGNAKGSLLYKLITHAREPHMPEGAGKLPTEAIAQIAAWIDHGAPYDKPLLEKKNDGPSWTQKVVADDARKFWSFQPLVRVEPPTPPAPPSKGGERWKWCQTPIDRFILAGLEANKLAPNSPVSKAQLIRRAYFDMLGLPPAPEEVQAFVNDASPTAYEKMIDRLLASPQYGERWGRHWLDLARFAESHGFEHDTDRPSAYHYRDFVIRALNDDMPYDTFVKWQLAGDEYAPESNLALTATGFLAAGVHSTQITKKEVEKHRYDEMDDMLATISTSMLGLTIGCARCHDHKFDPIPQADYYRLLATFTTTVRSDIDLNLDPAGYQKAKAAFDREHQPFVEAVRKFEAEQLPARWAEWERGLPPLGRGSWGGWIVVDPVSSKAEGGATFKNLGDGSLLVGDKNANFDTYTFVVHTERTGITALRLEALAHPSLVKGGPGRSKSGNFALSDFRLSITPKANAEASGGRKPPGESDVAKPVAIKLIKPRASFEQKGQPIAAAIDDNDKSAWAVDPELGKDHAAVFEPEKAIGFEGGSILTFTLRFKNNAGHSIGRPRLSIATAPNPVAFATDSIPEKTLRVLQLASAERTAEQKAELLKWYRTIDPEWQKLDQKAREHLRKEPKPPLVKALIASEGLQAVRLHTQGSDFLNETHFLRRGDPDQKEGVAGQGFLQVMINAADKEKRWQTPAPQGWRTSYRRRALAEWLTDVEHGAGQLLARVIVNRLWQHHMGRGIVATPSDFGTRGEKPTHPELLDWLAAELIANGWRLKPIHKLILSSAVYRQGPQVDSAKAKLDSDNRWFWRRPRQRLEAEVIRDALLAVSGELDPKMFGPGTLDAASKRRSIYFTVKRSKLMPMMVVFDAPEALGGVGARPTTTIAPQALLLMNNPHVRAYARSFARRVAPDSKTTLEDAVKAAYLVALTRTPTAAELTDGVAFVKQQMDSYKATAQGDGRDPALTDFCQVLMCLNEFVYVE